MPASSGLSLDQMLRVHASAVTYVLQTLIEQALALLGKVTESQGIQLSPAVMHFPEHLRFGVPSSGVRIPASRGVRHRWAANELGGTVALPEPYTIADIDVIGYARQLITDRDVWELRLGRLIYANTVQELSA